MPASIQSLPSEVLIRIFELAPTVQRGFTIDSRPFLRATSLVSRNWTHLSQAQLWHTIRVTQWRGSVQVSKILASPVCGDFVTRSFTLEGGDPSEEQMCQLLDRLYGLRILWICSILNFPASALKSSSLLGLKRLAFVSSFVSDLPEAADLPFRLNELILPADPQGPILIRSLLTSPHLHRLESNLTSGSPDMAALVAGFPQVAASLRELVLAPSDPALIPALAACTSLTSLTLLSHYATIELEHILATLPSPLTFLHIGLRAPRSEDRAPLFDYLLSRISDGGLGSLETLVLDVDPAKVRQSAAGKALLAKCEEVGVKLEPR